MKQFVLRELDDTLTNNNNGLKRKVWYWCSQNKIKYKKCWIVVPTIKDGSFTDSLTFSEPGIKFKTEEDAMAFKLRWL